MNHLLTFGIAAGPAAKGGEEMPDTRIARFHRIGLRFAFPPLPRGNEFPIDRPRIRHDLRDLVPGRQCRPEALSGLAASAAKTISEDGAGVTRHSKPYLELPFFCPTKCHNSSISTMVISSALRERV